MDVRIYVAQHLRYDWTLYLDSSLYVPIHAGKAVFEDSGIEGWLPAFGDDLGDNISFNNKLYSELTVLYWIWRNDTSDIVGLHHYRRHFEDPFNCGHPISKQSILELLENSDFLVLGPSDNVKPIYDKSGWPSGYSQFHTHEQTDVTLEVISQMFPSLYAGIEKEVKHNHLMCCTNMCIARKEHFNEYCEFLFPLFKEVETKLDLEDPKNNRVFGYISEQLFRPWLIASQHKFKELKLLDWDMYICYTMNDAWTKSKFIRKN